MFSRKNSLLKNLSKIYRRFWLIYRCSLGNRGGNRRIAHILSPFFFGKQTYCPWNSTGFWICASGCCTNSMVPGYTWRTKIELADNWGTGGRVNRGFVEKSGYFRWIQLNGKHRALEKRLWSRSSTKRLNLHENGWRQNLRSGTQNTTDVSGIKWIGGYYTFYCLLALGDRYAVAGI